MRADGRVRLQLGFPGTGTVTLPVLVALALVLALTLASCGSGPATPKAADTTLPHGATTTTTAAATTTTAAPSTAPSLPPVSTSGPLTVSAPVEIPFSADRVTAAESPDGAVFVAPQDPTSAAPAVAWVIDGLTPATVAEHVNAGIAALAADSNNFYAATYNTVYAYSRSTGDPDGQWTLPKVTPANSSDDDLVAMAAAGGNIDVSITSGDIVRVCTVVNRITSLPASDSTMVLPQVPNPTTAALIINHSTKLPARRTDQRCVIATTTQLIAQNRQYS